jgi:ribose 5-phosphate isomerase B
VKIAIGSDHAGFLYKERLRHGLGEMGHEVTDFGTGSTEPVDYPLVIRPVAEAVAAGRFECGIILGGSGNGEAMVANRIPGIRCAVCWNVESARLARRHNDANMLSLGERLIPASDLMPIVTAWLTTEFEGGRHARRIALIDVDEPITLTEPDPTWPSLFEAEAGRVRAALGTMAGTIEHVGSTAVPGLPGKPVVDLLVGVRTLAEGKEAARRLAPLGYLDFGELFIPGRLYLRRRGPPDFNLAIAEEGGEFFRSQLAVRDYLRAHPEEAKAYAGVKRKGWAHGARLFSTYSKWKHQFLTALVARAEAWARQR